MATEVAFVRIDGEGLYCDDRHPVWLVREYAVDVLISPTFKFSDWNEET